MPAVLPLRLVSPSPTASSIMPLAVPSSFEILQLKSVSGVPGLPAAFKGSVVYPAVFSFAIVTAGGFETRPGPGGKRSSYLRGSEDTDQRRVG